MQPKVKASILATLLLCIGFWSQLKPIVQPYIDKLPFVPSVLADASPFKSPGFKVLVVYPTEGDATRGQDLIINSTAIRSYVQSKNGECKFLDDQSQFVVEAQSGIWAELLKTPRDSPYWIYVGSADGKRGVSQALPPDETATLDLIKKFE